MTEQIVIDPITFWGGLVSVGGFFAWVIKYLLKDLKKVIQANTEALQHIRITLEKCKFVQQL